MPTIPSQCTQFLQRILLLRFQKTTPFCLHQYSEQSFSLLIWNEFIYIWLTRQMSHHCQSKGRQKKKEKRTVWSLQGVQKSCSYPITLKNLFLNKYHRCLSSNNLICLVCQTALVSFTLCKKIFKYISTFRNEMPKYNVVVYYLWILDHQKAEILILTHSHLIASFTN